MLALRIALLITDDVTLADVAPTRERLESLGAQVTVLVPSGGAILSISGRYYPAAGGPGPRRPLCQVLPADFDLLILPDLPGSEQLVKHAEALKFLQENFFAEGADPIPVFSLNYVEQLLDSGVDLSGLARPHELALAGNRMSPEPAGKGDGGAKRD